MAGVPENKAPMRPPPEFRSLSVIGAGRWGSALSIFLAERGCDVTVWAFEGEVSQQIQRDRTSPFLPGYTFPENIKATGDLDAAVSGKDLLVLAMPCRFLRGVMEKLRDLNSHCPLLTVNKGIEQDTCKSIPEIVREVMGVRPYAHLGGPCFPTGLLDPNTPVAETVASEDPYLARSIQNLFAWRNFRPYRSSDLKGVAVLGALKNVYAIAAGAASGLGLGQESLAVLVTRALAELRRLAAAMGIPEATVSGLSGVGDLVLTCYSPGSSHNRSLGVALGEGASVETVLKRFGKGIVEGYYTAASVRELAERYQVEMPIAEGVYRVLYEGATVRGIIGEFMERPLRSET